MTHAVDMSKVRARRDELKRISAEKKAHEAILDLKEGENLLRLLPPWSNAGEWRLQAWYHFLKPLSRAPFICLKKQFNQPCPACEVVERLFKSNDEAEKQQAYDWRAKARYFSNMLSLDKNDGKVYIFAFGVGIEQDVIEIMGSEDGFGKGDITHPETGYTVRITKTVPKDKMQTSYSVQCANQPKPVANWTEISKNLHNLDEIVTKDTKTFEQIKAILEGSAAPTSAIGSAAQTLPSKAADPGDGFEPLGGAKKEEFFAPPATEPKRAEFQSALDKLRAMKK